MSEDRNATPSDLAKVAAQYGLSKAVYERSLLGTGDRADSGGRKAQLHESPEPRSPHVHTLSAPASAVSFDSQASEAESRLNKTETRFLRWMRIRYEDFTHIGIQRMTFRLASGLKRGLRYTPDFDALYGGRWSFFEVKGPHMWDDARKSLVVVAAEFPWLDFYLCRPDTFGSVPFKITHVKP